MNEMTKRELVIALHEQTRRNMDLAARLRRAERPACPLCRLVAWMKRRTA